MNGTFTNSEEVLGYLQRKYGSANYRSWQTLRKTFYSYVNYPLAGQQVLTFFGTATGGVNAQFTNIPKANSVGQNHFLLKSIRMNYYLASEAVGSYVATDLTTPYSDFVAGLFQEGVFELNIGGRPFAQIPKPFLYAPRAGGSIEYLTAGVQTLVLVEAAPNTYPGTSSVSAPHADLIDRHANMYKVDPNILIEAEQSFEAKLSYMSATGLVPVIAQTIITADTNPLYVGVMLDGVQFRPVQ